MRRLRGLVAILGLAVAGCQGGAAATPAVTSAAGTLAPTSAAASTAVASTPPATLPVAVPRPDNIPSDGSCEDEDSSCLGVLEPGKAYSSKVFKPTVSFKVPTSGWINQFDGAGDIGLQSLDPAGDAIMFFRNPRSVDPSVGTKVDDIAMWLATYDKLTVTPFEPVKLGGLEGLTMDIAAASGATSTGDGCPVQVCIAMLRGDDPDPKDPYQWHWDWGSAGPERMRLYLLTDPDGTVAVVVDSVDGATFDSLISTWEKIAPTIKFG
jgi:hypothetical protein